MLLMLFGLTIAATTIGAGAYYYRKNPEKSQAVARTVIEPVIDFGIDLKHRLTETFQSNNRSCNVEDPNIAKILDVKIIQYDPANPEVRTIVNVPTTDFEFIFDYTWSKIKWQYLKNPLADNILMNIRYRFAGGEYCIILDETKTAEVLTNFNWVEEGIEKDIEDVVHNLDHKKVPWDELSNISQTIREYAGPLGDFYQSELELELNPYGFLTSDRKYPIFTNLNNCIKVIDIMGDTTILTLEE